MNKVAGQCAGVNGGPWRSTRTTPSASANPGRPACEAASR